MNANDLIAALDLPAGARVERRVPKTLLVENDAPTAADRRHVNEGVEELFWLAVLKPTTIGVPEDCDDVREYLEIAVLLEAPAGKPRHHDARRRRAGKGHRRRPAARDASGSASTQSAGRPAG